VRCVHTVGIVYFADVFSAQTSACVQAALQGHLVTRLVVAAPISPPFALQASAPRTRFYWGYIWDGTGNRATAPIRNPRNKSYMPVEQVRYRERGL
jgi:hypothetical protein